MNKQYLLIFKFNFLSELLKELEENINFEILEVSSDKILQEKKSSLINYIILTPKKLKNEPKQFILEKLPIKLLKLIEKINIEFLKNQYSEKSELKVGSYIINLNSRELIMKDKILKLTEKETKIITYLLKFKKPISIKELQSEVWGYNSKLETHTVETHIYRLREKIFKCFENKNFIISDKKGYKIILK